MKRIENILKNSLLKILLLLTRPEKAGSSIHLNQNSTILLIRLNRIGDALITTPFIKILKEKLNCRIIVLADKKNAFIFKNNPNIFKTFEFEKRLSGFSAASRLRKKYNIDCLVDLHDDVSATVSFLTALSGIKYRFALKKRNSALFTHTVERRNPAETHVADRILELIKLFGITERFDSVNIEYFPSGNAKERVAEFLKNNFNEKRFIFGVNISAGSDARFWGAENYKLLIKSLKEYNINLILIAAESDAGRAEKISEGKIPLFISPDFSEFAEMVFNLDFLFTPDTSIIHLASAAEVPVFGLFVKYNTDDAIWYPYKSRYDAVITTEPNLNNIKFEDIKSQFFAFFNKVFLNGNS